MEDFMERVIKEKNDLEEKIDKLSDFFNTPIFHSLLEEEQDRLNRQFYAMSLYYHILLERIDAFK